MKLPSLSVSVVLPSGTNSFTSDENLPPVTSTCSDAFCAFVSRTSIAFNVPDTSAVPPMSTFALGAS